MPSLRRSLHWSFIALVIALSITLPNRLDAQNVDTELAAKAQTYRLTETGLPKYVAVTRALAAEARMNPKLLEAWHASDAKARATAEGIIKRNGMTLDDYELFSAASAEASMAAYAIDMKYADVIRALPSMVKLNASFVKKHAAEYESLREDLELLGSERD